MRALAALIVICFAASAGAAPSTTEQKYKAAVKLENAGNVVDALAAFEALPVKDFNARLHIASCKRKLGRMLDAARDYESIRDDSTADTATKETAASDLDAVRAATPKLKITAVQADLMVSVDGAAVKVPAERLVDPGAHVVTATRAGAVVFERKVPLSESTSMDVVVDVPLPVAAPVTTTPVAAPPRVEEPSSDWKRPAGFVIGGVGIAALGLATFSALRIGSLERERDDLAATGDAAAFDRASDARTMQTMGRIALGVGLVGLGVGTYLVLATPKEKAVAVRVGPTVGTWGMRLEASW
jgi:hypothetical protein